MKSLNLNGPGIYLIKAVVKNTPIVSKIVVP
jgi:hypothetical protein